MAELNARGPGSGGVESGGFLLGSNRRGRREVKTVAYYDDLDPGCLDTGAILFESRGYSELWRLCSSLDMSVVADVHTHPGSGRQSCIDSDHPMIQTRGHIALVVPDLAVDRPVAPAVGVYEYLGARAWRLAPELLYIGRWG